MMKRKHSEMRENPHSDRGAKKKAGGYMGDPRLLPRIEQYLQSQKNKRVVSVVSMADDLQSRYSEYGRKKRNFFRKTVEKAYDSYCAQLAKDSSAARDGASVLEKKHLQKLNRNHDKSSSDSSDSEASFSDNNSSYVEHKDTNSMNSFMTQLYSSKRPLGLQSGASTPQTQPSSPQRSNDRDVKPFVTSTRPLKSQSCPASPNHPWHSDEGDLCDGLPFMIDRVGSGRNTLTADKAKVAGSPKAVAKDVAMSPVSKLKRDGVIQSPRSKVHPSSPLVQKLDCVAEDYAAESDDVIVIADDGVSGRSTPVVAEYPISGRSTPMLPELSTKDGDGGEFVDTGQRRSSRPASPHKEKSTRKVKKKLGVSDREVKKKGPEVQQSSVKFADVGGNESTLKEVCKLLVHMKHPEVYTALGVTPPRGFLLHGPPGCGKTLLAHAIAGELEVAFIKLAATEIVSGVSGESEEKLRDIFDKAVESAPCVLFLDEIDAITPKRETASKDMERRIVSQLLTCMDELASKSNAHVLVIGATNRPDSLDPALRRAGRFDREISLGIPDESARMRIMQVLCRGLRLSEECDFASLARLTPGFVGADLTALTREAAITAVNRVFKDLQEEHHSSAPELSSSRQIEGDLEKGSGDSIPTLLGDQQSQVNADTYKADCDVSRTLSVDGGTSDPPGSVEKPPTENETKSIEFVTNDNAQDVASSDASKDVSFISPKPELEVNAGDSLSGSATTECLKEKCYEEVAGCVDEHDGDEEMEVVDDTSVAASVGTESDSLKQTQEELSAVLKWLKDQPPLTPEQLASLWIKMSDFEEALKVVQPSAKREGFVTIPDTTWDDIGALRNVRDELQMAIMAPVQHPEYFKSLGLKSPPGILLAGPPGCGKTLLAKAIANESGINFISVKGPELLNMYVGESERAVRQVFQRARNSAPCVIFFDEIDALCPRRSDSGEGGSSVRVVNQLLTEMDGLEERKQVFIMAATNRPDIIDPAILRPGRLDKTLYVGLPTAGDRQDILITITKNGTKPVLSSDVSLQAIAAEERLNGFTGADLAALVREASVCALREFMTSDAHLKKSSSAQAPPAIIVHPRHFDIALSKVKASVSSKDQQFYEKMRKIRT